MQQIIDVAHNVGPYAQKLADLGVVSVIRYYNISNSSNLPSKCLTKAELTALHAAGLTVAVVFQAGGGANGKLSDLSDANGSRDAKRALKLAADLGQPTGSGLYFAVDHDYVAPGDLAQIVSYFAKVKAELDGRYVLGVYGSGLVARKLHDKGLVDLVWLSGSLGWSGTRSALKDGLWTLFQKDMELDLPFGGIDYDGNVFNAAVAHFGQFAADGPVETPRAVGASATFAITARGGLNLRAGPGESFGVIQKYPLDTLVRGVKQIGDWTQVDIQGDGASDGYMHSSYLKAEIGGLPVALTGSISKTPIDIAQAELSLGVAEVPGPDSNPRIGMYHATTEGGKAPDQTAWCSSFVSYCVEQAGMKGTDSKGARSWHDGEWGQDVTAEPAVGDIVVFSRVGNGDNGGHVAFFQSMTETTITCLGGNQGQRISISSYPKDGIKGPFHYKLLSIRRA
ncbi:TIGR02594 family protein [Rhizobium sp. DKSPLA3]|uniref:TIGR02594 family protein n=1 Tax=Rhizobium quercicola TaxID=2901226 RepID=A0A9X1NWL9_9HYPH|nr:TIGR02594 family protein [Rhizobium quercicola]MCD7111224.1 TIGR02594 family protein [Rhizobium quercicola]